VKTRLSVLVLSLAVIAGSNQVSGNEIPAQVPPQETRWLSHASQLERQQNRRALLALGHHWTQNEPDNATAWFVLGRAYSKTQRYPEAIEAYRRNLKIEPNDVHALNNLGNVYRDSRLPREAMLAYRDAVRIKPDYVEAWHNLGLSFFALKGAAGVTQALQQLHASDPKLAEAWRNLAIEYSLTRDQLVARKAINVLRGLDAEKRQQMFDILFSTV
jgi:tetratricopeptide (TPR) repeat protein